MSFGVGCTGGSKPADGDGAAGGIKIVATTGPVGDMVRAIAGDLAEVDVMMGPGVDPHLYKQLPSDVKKLDAADIVFFNGLHLEGQFAEVLEKRSEQYPVFAVTHDLEQAKDERLRYPSEFEGFADPHLWHDAALWSECAGSVAARLAEVDPDNADAYKAAGEAYRDELLQLDKECREQLASLPESSRVLVTAHDAFGYYSKAYGLESVGLKGISTEDEVALSRMDEVAQLIIDRGISAVFVESSETPRIVEAVIEPCVEAGHKVKIGGELFADALGPPGSGAETYIGMMRTNTATIVSGLKGE
ncbi:MAG: zinc ABC transporter substrate-binding protein [Planctomycetota bacterium]